MSEGLNEHGEFMRKASERVGEKPCHYIELLFHCINYALTMLLTKIQQG